MVKIYIDAGHGGNDPGAVGNGLREKDLTLDIAKRIKKYLDDNYTGHRIKLSRTTDKTMSLKQRTDDANKWGADFLLSIHINAGGGTGYEDYIYNRLSNSSKTAKIRDAIHGEIVKTLKEYGVTNRGKKKANFHVLRETKMPAMLSETLFIDTTKDAKLLKDNKFLKDIGQAHAKGIVKAFRLNGGSGSTNTSKPVANPSKTVAQLAQEVIAGKWGNGEDRRKNITQAGYDYSAVQAEVNRRLTGKAPKKTSKSISQMATEVIQGKHGVGHAQRRKSLGIDNATYQKVRAEVNRRLK